MKRKQAISPFQFAFYVEHLTEDDKWRATLDDDMERWGYGDTPAGAIAEYCAHFWPE